VLPKREVRITLAWPHDAHRFQSWCEDKEKDQAWLDKLAKGNRPDLWYLVERAISWQEWLLVEDLEEPKVIWRPADSCIPYLTARQIDDVKGALGKTSLPGTKCGLWLNSQRCWASSPARTNGRYAARAVSLRVGVANRLDVRATDFGEYGIRGRRNPSVVG